ncbi:subtilisin-like serine protease [Deinococcus sp. KSM4-11]|uniref:S8 family peptidase n=1 Tax=Deinococcus sp. KSM4-11 TaxID=2568654 RepID=UPI0010A3BBDF|nr:S8 family serine peptidase [Deinococcus sp. KSM4-11]THF84359.1 subtilisin-like serine protease [Deinococcus sp. KSM4-11]
MRIRSIVILMTSGSLLLCACSSLPSHPADPQSTLVAASLAATSPTGARLVDHAGFTTEGAKWWADGAKWWADGAKWWADGAKWWADGVFQPMPANSKLLQAVKIDVAQAHAHQMGKGVVVAVLDSGIDVEHPMLKGALLPGRDFVDNDLDPSEQGTDSEPAYGHGTAVAGVLRQVAPGAKILPVRVLSPDGFGDADNVASAIRFAVDQGAQIIHLSIAASVSNEGVRAALQHAVSRGVLVVAACGNDGSDRPESPANALDGKNPLGQYGVSVSAVNTDGTFPGWSTRGGEVLAPGVAVQSAYPGGRTVNASGSSFAAPLVTGALALALAEGKDARRLSAELSSGAMLDASRLLQ